jgi:hypothetical protein
MGGSGSGNFLRQGSRETCESLKSIELPVLRKQGMLDPGRKGVLTWSRDGKPVRCGYSWDIQSVDYSFSLSAS